MRFNLYSNQIDTSNFREVKLDPVRRNELKKKCLSIRPVFSDITIPNNCKVKQLFGAMRIENFKIANSKAADKWNDLHNNRLALNLSSLLFSVSISFLAKGRRPISSKAGELGKIVTENLLWMAISDIFYHPPKVQQGFTVTITTHFEYEWSPVKNTSNAYWSRSMSIENEKKKIIYIGKYKTMRDPDLSRDEVGAFVQIDNPLIETNELYY